MSEEQFASILRPYARAILEESKRNPGLKDAVKWLRYVETEDDVIEMALHRKRSIRRDVLKFYDDMLEARGPVRAPARVPTGVLERWEERIADAHTSGWEGRSFFVRGPDFEDMNLLLYGADGDGTFIEGRLRRAADARLTQILDVDTSDYTGDGFYEKVEKIAKSFNHHLGPGGDGIVPAHTVQLYDELVPALEALAERATDPFFRAQGRHYFDYLKRIRKGGEWQPEALGVRLEKYTGSAERLRQILPQGWKLETVDVGYERPSDVIERVLRGGRLVKGKGDPFRLDSDRGRMFKITAPDGTTIYYRPWRSPTGQPVGLQGHIRVWLPQEQLKDLSASRLQKAFENLKVLGIETTEATTQDLELLYLRKVSFKEGIDRRLLEKIPETLPVEEQIALLRKEYKRRKIAVPTSRELMGPKFHRKRGFGWARWDAHHIPQEELDQFVLEHELYGGDVAGSIARVLDGKTGGLISTREKMRIGVQVRGMSPTRDLDTGGASYVFTRLRRSSQSRHGGRIYFKGEALRDMDAISYSGDAYGKVTDAQLEDRILRKGWDKVASQRSADETIFKNGLDFEEFLESIVVDTEREREAVLAVFRERGIRKFAGKDIEDLVRVE